MRFLIVAVFVALGCSVAMARPNEKVSDDNSIINLIEHIEDALHSVPTKRVKRDLQSLFEDLKDTVNDVKDFGADVIKEGANNVEKAAQYTQDKASDVLEGVKNAVKDFHSNAKHESLEAVENVKEVINKTGSLLKDGIDFGGDIAGNALDSVADIVSGL